MKKHSLTATFLITWMGLLRQPLRSRGCKGLGGLTVAAITLLAPAVAAADLTAWNYDPTTQQLEMSAKAGIKPRYFLMAQPARIVVDLPDTEMGDVKTRATFESGAIRQVRISQFQPGVTRVVLELAPNVELAAEQVKLESKGDRWILRPLLARQQPTATQPSPAKTASTATRREPLPPQPAQETAPIPLAIGADISPVTSEPPIPPQVAVPPSVNPSPAVPSPIAVPPLATPPAPISVPPLTTPPAPLAVPPLAPPTSQPPAPIPIVAQSPALPAAPPSSLAAPSATLPPLAQLPPEATTPLPPDTELPSSRVITEGNNTITISVPSPIAMPAIAPEIVPPIPSARAPVPAKPAGAMPPTGTLEIPSTAQMLLPAPTAQVAVPTLQPATGAIAPSPAPSVVTPLPPMTVPPSVPVTVPSASIPTVQPAAGSITTTHGGHPTGTIKIQPVLPNPLPSMPGSVPVTTTTAPPRVQQQPPNSWVMQSSGLPQPTTINVPPAKVTVPSVALPPATVTPLPQAIAPPATPSRTAAPTTVPPTSWVMQSSGLPQPSLVQPLPQPPISSVMQPSGPAAIAPMPVSSVMQPATIPSSPNLTGSAATVSVPPFPSPALPPASMPAVSVPALQASPMQPMTMPTPVNPTGVVEFGQPLPTPGATALNTAPMGLPTTIAANSTVSGGQVIPPRQTGVAQSINPTIALPTGTVLALSYPGITELQLDAATPRQEMLVLQTEVRDASGAVVFPRGSYVMGRFEPGRTGTKFTASAIQRGDRIVPFLAESDAIGGSREINPTSMALYSGAGALAGGLVSSFSGWGLLLGGAAGAATSYLTTPKPTGIIQPGQVIPVRMLQDIPF